MSDSAFDTLVAARKLKTAGIEAEQADAIVEVMGESVNQLVTVEHFDAGLAMLHARIDGQSSRIDSSQTHLQARIDGLSGRIDSLQTELQAQIDGLSGRIDSLQTELQAQIDGLSGRIDSLQTELQAQIDGLSGRIDSLQTELQAQIDSLRVEMRADIARSHMILGGFVIAANVLMLTVLGILLMN